MSIIAILGLATILRFVALTRYGDFWDDEMFNFMYSQKAWPEGLVYWLWETNPPLHLFILKIWLYIFPATEFFTRLPSVITGVVTVWAIYILGKTLFNKNTGLLVAFYLAIHPYHILWSATARIYVFLILLVTLSTYLFYKRFFQNNHQPSISHTRWLSPFINLLLIFSHLTSLFFFAGQFIVLIGLKGRSVAWQWIEQNLVPFSIGGLWIIASFWIKIGNNLEDSWFLNMGHTLETYINPLLNLFVGQYSLFLGLALLVTITIFIIISFYKEAKQNRNQLLILIILMLIPLLISATFDVWHIKFFLCVLPLFILIISHSLLTIFNKQKLAFSAILLVCATGLFNLWKTLPLTDWSQIETYLKTKPVQTIFIYNNYNLKPQIDRYLPDLATSAIPLVIYENLSWDDMIVKKNYIFKQITTEEKNIWYNNNELSKYSSLVLLQGKYTYISKLDDTLTAQGWELKQGPELATVSGDYYLYWYEKN
ncbi:MAG: glycosyltransferase family 39 protein [bacterium]|nr:glycosyltransferase family 39 protein [bacterium]